MLSTTFPHAPHSFINPEQLYDPRPNGYTHVVVATMPARVVYVAGQGGEDSAGQLAVDFELQVKQALTNLGTALAAADAAFHDVVKITVLIVDYDTVRLAVFTRLLGVAWHGHPSPACTLIPVARLALEGMLFEIEATAALRLSAIPA